MTLNDFTNTCINSACGETSIYVFDDEECMEGFIKKTDDYELLFTLKSSFQCRRYLKPMYADAEVINFVALGRDMITVLIEPRKE